MNKILVVSVSDKHQGNINAGGIDLATVAGLRDALALAEFARANLTEALIGAKAEELARAKRNEPTDSQKEEEGVQDAVE